MLLAGDSRYAPTLAASYAVARAPRALVAFIPQPSSEWLLPVIPPVVLEDQVASHGLRASATDENRNKSIRSPAYPPIDRITTVEIELVESITLQYAVDISTAALVDNTSDDLS